MKKLLKRVSYLLIFVILENETFIFVISDPLFLPFVNRARDLSLYDPPHRNVDVFCI